MVVLQGRDSAGKDGAIKHVVGYLNPRGVNVVSFGVPTPEEREHDFLWRVHRHAPRAGRIRDLQPLALRGRARGARARPRAEEALARALRPHRRLRGAARRARHHRAQVLPAHRAASEQKLRLMEREKDPRTAWKLNPERLARARALGRVHRAYEDAISKTATKKAPWIVVPANAKWYRNLVIAESIVEAMRERRGAWKRRLDGHGRRRARGAREVPRGAALRRRAARSARPAGLPSR